MSKRISEDVAKIGTLVEVDYTTGTHAVVRVRLADGCVVLVKYGFFSRSIVLL